MIPDLSLGRIEESLIGINGREVRRLMYENKDGLSKTYFGARVCVPYSYVLV